MLNDWTILLYAIYFICLNPCFEATDIRGKYSYSETRFVDTLKIWYNENSLRQLGWMKWGTRNLTALKSLFVTHSWTLCSSGNSHALHPLEWVLRWACHQALTETDEICCRWLELGIINILLSDEILRDELLWSKTIRRLEVQFDLSVSNVAVRLRGGQLIKVFATSEMM